MTLELDGNASLTVPAAAFVAVEFSSNGSSGNGSSSWSATLVGLAASPGSWATLGLPLFYNRFLSLNAAVQRMIFTGLIGEAGCASLDIVQPAFPGALSPPPPQSQPPLPSGAVAAWRQCLSPALAAVVVATLLQMCS